MAYTTIDKPTDYFNTKLYTGTGSTHNITGVGFQPDWVWIKSRSDAYAHYVFDVIRGATKQVQTNLADPETTSANQLTSFDSDGFTLGTDIVTNGSSKTFASWNWLAGGTASSNTDGSITSSVSASTTSGFSIVSYTGNGSAGATVGHGLGSAPAVMIFKIRNTADNWRVYHQGIDATAPEDYHVQFNSTGARIDNSGFFNDTAPTSSVFTLGSDSGINGSSNTFIAYCFAEKKGYSKFGSYQGNSSTDGTFVFLGFKPAFLIAKCSSATGSWFMADNKRDGFNVITKALLAESSAIEANETYHAVDFLSNGFKWRGSDDRVNVSGKTYIYMAFAENPFVTSTGIPTTAR